MRGLSFGIIASSAAGGGGSPTVFTLVLDDLLTRHYPGTDQRFKLSLTSPTAGDSDWIEIDDNATIHSASVIAADMQTKLRAVAGYAGKVSVSGASSEAGDKYTFTVSFDGSLIGVGFEFNGASQFYPTITLTESVTQQGVTEVVGVQAVYTLDCTQANGGDENPETVSFVGGGTVTYDDNDSLINAVDNPPGWDLTAGGVGNPFVTFTHSGTGVFTLAIASQTEDGIYSLTQDVAGVDAVTGQPEIHTITPTPVNPTNGTWKPASDVLAVNFNDAAATIETALAGTVNGFGGATVSGTLDSGPVTVTGVANADLSDTALSPVNVDLTAPEITHSIT